MDERETKIFENIVSFVSDLTEVFGTKQHSLLLYNRLLQKTGNDNINAVRKHIEAFNKFISENQEAILKKNFKEFVNPIIEYSPKVNIKIDEIFKMADVETSSTIWKHLLLIMSTIDPSTKAMNILKESLEEKTNESQFLNDMFDKIKDNVDSQNEDPMAALMGLMSSGVVPQLVTSMTNGMQNGSLDMTKLFGTVQSMMTSLGGAEGLPLQTMLPTMMAQMGQIDEAAQPAAVSIATTETTEVTDESVTSVVSRAPGNSNDLD